MFYDGVAPEPYTLETLKVKSLGGTEASCIRIVSRLATDGYNMVLAQRNRINYHTEVLGAGSITYCPLEAEFTDKNFAAVVSLRDAGHYLKNKEKYPNAKHFLWMHDVVGGDYQDHMNYHLNGKNADLICVSDWHKRNILISVNAKLNVKRIFGPLADYCVKTPNTEYDPNQLIFFSSPHKGLKGTLEIFVKLRKKDPSFYLKLSNPGYFADAQGLPEGVTSLGSVPHHSILMDHVRKSLCLFYPNTVFEETFGLVMAEANSVGTPVIAHPIGAAPEVTQHPKELLDCNDHDRVIERVLAWKAGERPIVGPKKEFTMNEVIKEWKKILQ